MNQKERRTISELLEAYDIEKMAPEFSKKLTDLMLGKDIVVEKKEDEPQVVIPVVTEPEAPVTQAPATPTAEAAPVAQASEATSAEPQVITHITGIKKDPEKAKGIGLVFDGGGGKGAYQLGVIKALTENNLLDDVTMLAGSSIGAVNSMLYAMEDLDLMYRAWDEITMLTLFDISAEQLAAGNLHFSREDMIRLCDKYTDYDKLKDSKYDIYHTIARTFGFPEKYEAEYVRINELSKEMIKKVLMASTALPAVYGAVEIKGAQYRDGGLADNTPIRPLYEAGIRSFVVISLNSQKVIDESAFPDAHIIHIKPSRNLGSVLDGTLNFSKNEIKFREMLGYKDGLRAIKTKFYRDEMYIRMEPVLAENDYNDIVRQLRVDVKYEVLNTSVNSNISKFEEIAKKYDI